MPVRGTYGFEIGDDGRVVDNESNVNSLRKLFRDGTIINEQWGPGNRGDFDYGGWHCLCHLAAGAGVYRRSTGYLWVAITHSKREDKYLATVSYRDSDGTAMTCELGSSEGRAALNGATPVGYVEGTSRGHISARGVRDPERAFNGWPRQEFDQEAGKNLDGGTVWEHWCTTRDLRPSSPVGDSVLRSYLTLVSTLGGKFVAAVVRGRRSYFHPVHLCALVKAGFISRDEALWATMPKEIPGRAEGLLLEATPDRALEAAAMLLWEPSGELSYHMYKRKIREWSKKENVESDLRGFGL